MISPYKHETKKFLCREKVNKKVYIGFIDLSFVRVCTELIKMCLQVIFEYILTLFISLCSYSKMKFCESSLSQIIYV